MISAVILPVIVVFVHTSAGIKLGLFSGDLTRLSLPLRVSRIAHHAPVFININGAKAPLTLPPPILPAKPSLLAKPVLPPLLPLPLLPPPLPPLVPILPPPLLPKFPLLPSPLPHLPVLPPRLSSVHTPLPKPLLTQPLIPKTSLGRKIAFKKALRKVKSPLKLPLKTGLKNRLDLKPNALEKLLDLKKKGSLTSAEFHRFRSLLL